MRLYHAEGAEGATHFLARPKRRWLSRLLTLTGKGGAMLLTRSSTAGIASSATNETTQICPSEQVQGRNGMN